MAHDNTNGDEAPPEHDYLKRVTPARLHDTLLEAKYPLVAEYLVPRYDGRKMLRQEARLSITVVRAEWLATIDMPTEKTSGTLSLTSLVNLLEQLEDGLSSDHFAWDDNYKKRKAELRRLDKLV